MTAFHNGFDCVWKSRKKQNVIICKTLKYLLKNSTRPYQFYKYREYYSMQYVAYILTLLRPHDLSVIPQTCCDVIASLRELSIFTAFVFTDFIHFLKKRG